MKAGEVRRWRNALLMLGKVVGGILAFAVPAPLVAPLAAMHLPIWCAYLLRR